MIRVVHASVVKKRVSDFLSGVVWFSDKVTSSGYCEAMVMRKSPLTVPGAGRCLVVFIIFPKVLELFTLGLV